MIEDDTRAVSVAVTHTMMLGITGILIAGLLLSSGSLLQTQENRVGQQQADEIASDILSHVDTLDRLNETGDSVITEISLNYPNSIAGEPYIVRFNDSNGRYATNKVLEMDAPGLGRTISYPVPDDTPIKNSNASGSNPQLSLCSDEIIFGEC